MFRFVPLAIAASLLGCTRTVDFETVWIAGDLHVHSSAGSNDTDGESFPSDIAAAARDRGLGFVVLTEHSNSAGSMHCEDVEDCPNLGPEFGSQAEAAELSDDGFVMVVGSEMSPLGTGHVGCLPPDGGFAFDGAIIDRPDGEVDGEDVVDQCRDLGGLVVVNHPQAQASWIRWDWSTAGYDALEVWNGGLRWDPGDEAALVVWECSVARGQGTIPVAASDNHRVGIEVPGEALNPPLGQPRTSVGLLADVEPTWEAIRRGLLSGRVVLHEEGTFIEATTLTWSRSKEDWTIAGVAPLPARVELRAVPRFRPEDDSCDPATVEDPLHEVLWEADVDGPFELQTGPLEHDPKEPGLRYLALVRDDAEPSNEGGVAFTGLLGTPP